MPMGDILRLHIKEPLGFEIGDEGIELCEGVRGQAVAGEILARKGLRMVEQEFATVPTL